MMEIIEEEFDLDINGGKISIVHKGIRPIKIQVGGLQILSELVREELEAGKNKGFFPYNNFECSIDWKSQFLVNKKADQY